MARLAEEIAKSGIPEGSRKINGKYIHTHLVTRLKGAIMLFIYPNISTTSIYGLHVYLWTIVLYFIMK